MKLRLSMGLVFISGLGLLPNPLCAADVDFIFSYSLPKTGTVSSNMVSGVDFNAIIFDSQIFPVNTFVESYNNDMLTFTVNGGGSLASTGLFSNVSGTFLTIDESAPVFGTNPQTLDLLTNVTSIDISPAFLSDIGVDLSFMLDESGCPGQTNCTAISVATGDVNGDVDSTDATFDLQLVPEPSTLWTLGFGLAVFATLSFLRRRRNNWRRETHRVSIFG